MVKKTHGKQRVRLAYAAGVVVGWHSHVGDGREKEQVEAWQRLISRPPYWEPADEAVKTEEKERAAAGEAATSPEQLPPDSPEKATPGSGGTPRARRRIRHG